MFPTDVPSKDKYYTLLQFPFLSTHEMAALIWAAEGVKPISFVQLAEDVDEEGVSVLVHILERYGLYVAYRKVCARKFPLIPVLSCGLKREDVEEDVALDNSRRHRKTLWRAYGLLFGYPLTSNRRIRIEAIGQRRGGVANRFLGRRDKELLPIPPIRLFCRSLARGGGLHASLDRNPRREGA